MTEVTEHASTTSSLQWSLLLSCMDFTAVFKYRWRPLPSWNAAPDFAFLFPPTLLHAVNFPLSNSSDHFTWHFLRFSPWCSSQPSLYHLIPSIPVIIHQYTLHESFQKLYFWLQPSNSLLDISTWVPIEYLKGEQSSWSPIFHPQPQAFSFSYLHHIHAPVKKLFKKHSKPATMPSALPPKCAPGVPTSHHLHCHNQVQITVFCHFHLHYLLSGLLLLISTPSQQFIVIQSLNHVWLCNPMDYSLPGSSVYRISQERILGWVAISFSRGSSEVRDWTVSPALTGGFFTNEPPEKLLTTIIPR